jgi:putative membrane protein
VSITKSLLSGTIVTALSLCVPAYSQQTGTQQPQTTRDRSQTGTSTAGQSSKRSTAGQESADRSTGGGSAIKSSDRTFVTNAAMGGMAEVELGNLAKEKASSDAVKQFGQRMVTDHTKANDQLKQVAASKNITLPTSLDAKHQAMKDRLSKLSGAEFDRAYMKDMVADHEKDVKEFQKESQSGSDPEIKNFASQTLPTLQEHLQMAKDTDNGVKGSPSTADRSKQQ